MATWRDRDDRKRTRDDYDIADGPPFSKRGRRSDPTGYRRGRDRVAAHHKELSSEERLVSFIERVGEDTTQSSLESNLEKLAELICQELVEFKDKILQVITKCAREYSGKVSIYTTLVGILNARKVDIGNELVDLLFEDLKSALISNDFTTVRTLVRFLSDLMNAKVVPPSSIIALFDTFITVTYEPGISQLRSDWYMNLILSALPWVGAELQSKRQMDLERLMTAIEGYMSKRITNYLPAIQVWQTERPYPQRDQLELLWSQIFKMKENNWKETILLRPYTSLGNEISAYTHPLPNIVVPGHTIDSTYPLPTVVFRCIGDTDLPAHFGLSFPSIDSIDYYLIQDIIRSIINSHSSDRKNCAHQLNLLIEKYSNVPVEYMLAEVVFGMMLQLPSPTHCLLYYGSLNIELCKLRPATYPLILSQFIDILFAQLDHMNSIAVNRFAWWFSYHLSNYQYLWEWTKWVWCVQCPPDNISHRFVKLVFQCCSRLASYETFSEIIPEVFHPLLPALPTSDFLYEKDIEGSQLAGKLIESIRAKIPLDELLAVLNEDMGIDDDQHLLDVKISVLTHCVLHIGDKTISHCFIALHKFRSLFLALLETDHAKIKCLCSVAEFFTLNPQLHCLVIDKLVRQELIDNSTVINWLFGHADHIDLTSRLTWDIVSGSCNRVIKGLIQYQKELNDIKTKLKLTSDLDDVVGNEEKQELLWKLQELEEKCVEKKKEQREVLLAICKHLVAALSKLLCLYDQDGMDYETSDFLCIFDYLRQILMENHSVFRHYTHLLETEVFTSEIDSRIFDAFQPFQAIL